MTVITDGGKLVTRLRGEGSAVVVSIPKVLRDELLMKAGDLVMVSAESGALVLRKVDIRAVVRRGSGDFHGA